MSGRRTTTENRPLRGIALKIAAVCAFLTMFTLIKLAGPLPPGEIVFFRSFFAILPVTAYVLLTGEGLAAFRSSDPAGQIWRGVIGVTSMGLGFYGLTKLPLPEAVVIGYAMPLFTVILGWALLKEKVRAYRWSAVVLGLAGVVMASWPRLTVLGAPDLATRELAFGALAVIGSAAFAAGAMIQVRRLVAREATNTIVLWFSITSSALALLTIPFGWEVPTPRAFALLMVGGFFGGLGQVLMTSCYRFADVSTIAPFEYTSFLVSLLIGWLVFADAPSWQMLSGGLVVVAAGLAIIWRERRLGLRREPAETAEL
ncbi:MAG: DMT family transporter [Rhizobiaceae bacterium]